MARGLSYPYTSSQSVIRNPLKLPFICASNSFFGPGDLYAIFIIYLGPSETGGKPLKE